MNNPARHVASRCRERAARERYVSFTTKRWIMASPEQGALYEFREVVRIMDGGASSPPRFQVEAAKMRRDHRV